MSSMSPTKRQKITDVEDACDGLVRLSNPHLAEMQEDFLYHLALSTSTHNLKAMFGDVKFVIVGGSASRMRMMAEELVDIVGVQVPAGMTLQNIAKGKGRYAIYKVGPVLTVSHGMGVPSMSILFHELFKLLQHAGCRNPVIFRLGTCGGLGLPPGSVVITEEALDPMLRPVHEVVSLCKVISRPAILDQDLVEELINLSDPSDGFEVVKGKTMCSHDFYEGQARLDGAFCEYTEKDKMDFLHTIHSKGVRNIEMEAIAFAALCHHAKIRGAIACVTLLDRLKGDQVDTPSEVREEWQKRPLKVVARYIQKHL